MDQARGYTVLNSIHSSLFSRYGSSSITTTYKSTITTCSFVILVGIVLFITSLVAARTALADTGILRVVPVADAYVNEEAPNTTYGGLPHLMIGLTSEFGLLHRSYLLFDLTGLPSDADIGSATLKIYLHTADLGGDIEIDIGAVDESWSETGPDGIAWGDLGTMDRQPASTPAGSVPLTTALGWKDIEITDLVNSWIDSSRPNHGLRLSLNNEERYKTEGPFLHRGFYSRESPICRPYLEIVYTASEVPPDPTPPSCEPLSDTTPPELGNINASSDPAIAGEEVRISVTADDSEGMYRLQLMRGAEIIGDITSETGEASMALEVAETLAPGRHHYSAIAWNRSMLSDTRARSLRVEHDGEPPSVEVSHSPAAPAAGDTITFSVDANDDSGIEQVTLIVQGIPNDRMLSTEVDIHEEFSYDLRPDMRVVRYSAAVTDSEGRYASTGTKYILIDNTGSDADEDGLSDIIEGHMGLDPENSDTDGDGLYDGWEVIGLDRSADGTIDLDLPMLGANPHHKDMFVEIDWMEDETRSTRPHTTSVQALVNAFRNHGIRLHVDTGNLGGGNAVPYETDTCSYESDWLSDTKGANFDPNRRGIFYYIGSMPSGEGCGSKYKGGGNVILRSRTIHGYAFTMMHELGHALGVHHGSQKQLTTPRSVETLGPNGEVVTDDDIYWEETDENYKPNYLSIMNYQYMWTLRICSIPDPDHPCTCTGHLDDAARAAVTNACDDVYPMTFNLTSRPINENALDEMAGFTAPVDIGSYIWRRATSEMELYRPTLNGWYYIRRYPMGECCTTDCRPNPDDVTLSLADGSPIDWNFSDTIDDGTVAYDLNRYWSGLRNVCQDTLDTNLLAPSEIPLLRTKIWGNINFGFTDDEPSPIDPPERVTPTDGEVADDIDNDGDGRIDEGFPDIDTDNIADAIDNCAFTSNPDQFDTDGNHRGDACAGLPDPPGNLRLAAVDHAVKLQWDPSEATNILGYNVYRKNDNGSDFHRIGMSFPTTLGKASFTDADCVDGTIYSINGVNMYMDEGRLSEGVVMSDTDGDGVCDRIAAHLPDPYGKPNDAYQPEEMQLWIWFLLLLVLLSILAIIFFAFARRSRS